jgi:hypothetical protein
VTIVGIEAIAINFNAIPANADRAIGVSPSHRITALLPACRDSCVIDRGVGSYFMTMKA